MSNTKQDEQGQNPINPWIYPDWNSPEPCSKIPVIRWPMSSASSWVAAVTPASLPKSCFVTQDARRDSRWHTRSSHIATSFSPLLFHICIIVFKNVQNQLNLGSDRSDRLARAAQRRFRIETVPNRMNTVWIDPERLFCSRPLTSNVRRLRNESRNVRSGSRNQDESVNRPTDVTFEKASFWTLSHLHKLNPVTY